MNRFALGLTLGLGLLVGCKKEEEKPIDDTGVPTTDDSATDSPTDSDSPVDTDTAPPPCTTTIVAQEPADLATGVYYRDPVVVSFDGDAAAASLVLTDPAGTVLSPALSWSEGNVQAQLSTVLAPDTTYTLTVDICQTHTVTTFTTSHLGAPLIDGTASLNGKTWKFRLSDDADITEPAFLDVVASTYVTTPILIGVEFSDDTTLDLMGALGVYSPGDNSYYQDTSETPWDFPAADFTAAPFFSATAELAHLTYQEIDVPIEQFHLEGTIADDGSYIGEGRASGYLDTRNAGVWVGRSGDEGAVCETAAAAGVTCVACLDGNPYCMLVIAENIYAEEIPGLTLSWTP